MSGLTISSLGAINTYIASTDNTPTEKALTSLGNALKSGDLDTAKTSATTLQQTVTGLLSGSNLPGKAATEALSIMSRNVEFVTKAINAGDTKTAQKEFDKLKSTYKNFKSVTSALTSSNSESTNIATQIFDSINPLAGQSTHQSLDNIENMLTAYTYFLSNGSAKPSIPPGTLYNERA